MIVSFRATCDSVNSGSALVSRLYTQQNIAVHGAAVVALVHQYLATLAEAAPTQ
jgi:hypothetical protein